MSGPSLSLSCPAVLLQTRHFNTICEACIYVFVRLFVTVENKKLVNLTPADGRASGESHDPTRFLYIYSYRNALRGSILIARRAGM